MECLNCKKDIFVKEIKKHMTLTCAIEDAL